MIAENILQEKTFGFAIEVVELYQYLITEKKEFVLSKLLLQSGISIGQIVEDATAGNDEINFFDNIDLAYRKARETHYWLRLLFNMRSIPSMKFCK